MDRRLFLTRSLSLTTGLTLASIAQGQENRPIRYTDLPNNGTPYNLIPVGSGVRYYRGRECPDFVRSSNDAAARLRFGAYVIGAPEGRKEREFQFYWRLTPRDAVSEFDSLPLPFAVADVALFRFQEILRIGRNWRQEGIPKEDEVAETVPVAGMRCAIARTKGRGASFPVTIQGRKLAFVFNDLEDYSRMVQTFSDYTRWLEAQ